MALAVPPQFGDVDAVWRDGHVDGDEHVGRSETDGPPPPVAGHDGAGQGKGTAQEILGRFHVAHLDEPADDGAADGCRPARPFEEGQGDDGDAVLAHEEFHGLRIACRLGTIGEVRADDDGRRMDVGQEVLAELFRRFLQEGLAHGQENQAVDADGFDIFRFLANRGQAQRFFFRTQHGQRMGRKGDDHGFHTAGSGPFDGRLHDHLVAPVDAVKGPKGHDGSGKAGYFLKGVEYFHR